MVACTMKYRCSSTPVLKEIADEIISTAKDFGVVKEYNDIAKRILAYNLRQGSRKYRVVSKYWFVNGKCVDMTKKVDDGK